jgi:hypothetical protein
MTEQRRDPRYRVRLAVRYTNAEEFVTDYVENLSTGGLYIVGATQLALEAETDVQIELPGQGAWTVRGKVEFVLDTQAAARGGRKPGAGLSIIDRPPGFDDALLGYLLRLGRRREHAVMIADDMVGRSLVEDAGYRVLPLESRDEIAFSLVDESAKVVAIIASPGLAQSYRDRLEERSKHLVFDATTIEEVSDILARIDSLL